MKRLSLALAAGAALTMGSAQALTYANWTFNDGTGADSSGNNHNLGGNGPVIASPAGWGPSASCTSHGPGARDGYECFTDTSGWGLPTDNFTVGVWAKADVQAASNDSQSSMFDTQGGNALWIGTRKDSGVWNWVINIGGTSLATFPTTPATAQHIEVTREAGDYSVWLDNTQVAGPITAGGPSWGSLHVGVNSGGGTGYSGLLGDITLTDPVEHSPDALIKTFGLPGMPATIDQTAKTISWPVTYESTPASLAAEFTTSSGAIVYDDDPDGSGGVIASGTARDFTSPVHYWVRSSDNLVTNDYTVTVNQAAVSSDADIVSFGPADNPGTIIGTDITWTAPYGTDLVTLAPVYTTSPYFGGSATGSPASGVAPSPSFADGPATYTITAQDGTTQKVYTVTVNSGRSPLVPGASSGLVCWYDAAQGIATDGGSGVTGWADQSGNGNHATTGVGTPALATSQVNGLPAVLFRGNNLNINYNIEPWQEFIVLRSGRYSVDPGNPSHWGNDWGGPIGQQNDDGWMLQPGSTQMWDSRVPNAVSVNGIGATKSGNNWQFSNDVNQYMVLQVDPVNHNSAFGRLGRPNNSWGNGEVDVAEIIVYDHVLSAEEANLVGGYLAAKYGVATAYPALPLAVSVTSPADNQAYPSGASITATAAVIPGSGTGPYSVQFYLKTGAGAFIAEGSPVVGAGPTFDLSLGALALDTYEIYADISDTGSGPFSSAINTFTVEAAVPTTTALATSGSPSTYGDSVTFTATVDPVPSGGTVQFYADSNPIGLPVAVNTGDGTAQYSTTLLGASSHSITANFSGHGVYVASIASALTQTVDQAVLTVTADNKVRAPGTANPPLTYKITGYQNGQNATSAGITGAPGLSTLADTGSGEGSYEITCTTGDLAAANYSFTSVNGNLTVMAGAPPVGSGMVCWFDASNGVTADGGASGTVSAWNDLSGNAHHGTAASGTTTLVANQLNGKPAVQFRDSHLNLDLPLFTAQQYLVLRSPTPLWDGGGTFLGPNNVRIYDMFNGEWAGSPGNVGGFWTDPAPFAVARNGTPVDPHWGNNFGFPLNPIDVYMLVKIDVNTTAKAGAGDPQSYQLGRSADVGYVDFDLCEIIAYDHVLTTDEEKLLGAYIADKYALPIATGWTKTVLDVSASGTGAEILNDGTLVEANHFGSSPVDPVVLDNGLTFGISTASLIRPDGPNFQAEWEYNGTQTYQTGWSHNSSDNRVADNGYGITNPGFYDLMRSAWWVAYSGSRSDMEIPGLTVGHTYRLQLISEHPQDGTVAVEGSDPYPWMSGDHSVLSYTWVATDDTLNMQYSRRVSHRDTGQGQGGEVFINGYALHDMSGGAVPDYDTWAGPSGYNLTGGPGDDDDRDGLTNEEEYAFGLDPTSGSSVSPFTQSLDKGTGLFSYTRRNTSLSSLNYSYEWSATLDDDWAAFTPASESTDAGSPVEEVTIEVPGDLLLNPTLFVRVIAAE